MQEIFQAPNCKLYLVGQKNNFEKIIATTPETRTICNDPFVIGLDYTEKLKRATAGILKAFAKEKSAEKNAVVLHILRGGINFGLREALGEAYDWNSHGSAFISSQRACDEKGDWHITENRYSKVYLPEIVDFYFGDVVATGVSLEYALEKMIELAKKENKQIRSITFFTIGGERANEILEAVAKKCAAAFPKFERVRVIFLEGIFGVPTAETPLSIKLLGTDLLRYPAILAPEFLASQAEKIEYALERCAIYDAGSRSFNPREHLEDVREYWQQVLELAENGITLIDYLRERLPTDSRLADEKWCGENNSAEKLKEIAEQQINLST